ncbi:hypothetical protein RND81_06G223800 [Saponaria officinalis]|uniref:non-specific serine/threonine protein kinase n=1 Tax=Saponaria officinalis TaxID=3572 RepID=A0AAW1KFL2_SAPOF
MEAQISTSKLPHVAGNFMEKSWHLVAVLLSIGRPASPAELAGKCSIFYASPEFVEFLCLIPNSPLCLSKTGVVLLSAVALRAVGGFFAISLPKVEIGVFGAAAAAFCGRGVGHVTRTYFRKQKSLGSEVVPFVNERAAVRLIEGNEQEKERLRFNDRLVLDLNALPLDMPRGAALGNFSDKAVSPSVAISNNGLLEYQSKKAEDEGSGSKPNATQVNDIHDYVASEGHLDEYINNIETFLDMPDAQGERCGALFFESLAEISAFLGVDEPDPAELIPNIDTGASSCTNLDQHVKNTSLKAPVIFHPHEDFTNRQVPEIKTEDMVDQRLNNHDTHEERAEKQKQSVGLCKEGSFCKDIVCYTTVESSTGKQPNLRENVANNIAGDQAVVPAKPDYGGQKSLSKVSAIPKNVPQLEPPLKQKAPPKLLLNSKIDIFNKDRKGQKDQNAIALRDNSKHIVRNNAVIQEKCANTSLKDQQKAKYPEFESYIVEEEEGSGGYGTVYRARRKADGVTFAIKCPHANAHINHLKNELKMLQRFGGKNFIIKYEGSLKSGNGDCFVLEHVEHDRAEALKREIDIYQLQWYGFCLFKALSSLHKQGVFHRDVKPGNFLFSCKTSKGYLIDFNLAKDLPKKPGNFDQSQPGYMNAIEHVPAPQHKSASPNKRRKILKDKPLETYKVGGTSGANHILGSKTLKRKAVDKLRAYDDFGRRNSVPSQGADGSGLTSKDLTSARTSGDKFREPIPCQGRKELINLAQEAMQSQDPGTGRAPVLKRKRVAAPPVFMDQKFIYLTPTPLQSSGNCISGAGSWNNRGVKPQKEGPCVGTKGFRAPEVLLRSSYQGPKIDVWSAGVTLLYLITGKMPFSGDPEQNMKDIVKMKGNEELWEVAKLHNRESSFPKELLDVRFLQSMTIKEWCVANTKRVKFLDAIPASLFDLIEKCLTVNPRLRITAEEAFKHKFFAQCHDALQSMKLHRLSQNQHSRSNSMSSFPEPIETPNTQG